MISTTSSWPRGQLRVDQRVALLDADGDDAAFADVAEIRSSAVFLTVPCARGEEDVQFGCVQVRSSLFGPVLAMDADEGGDFFVGLQFEQIGDAAALGGAAHVGDFMDALDIDAAGVGEEHEVIVRAGGEEVLDEILGPRPAWRKFRGWSCR